MLEELTCTVYISVVMAGLSNLSVIVLKCGCVIQILVLIMKRCLIFIPSFTILTFSVKSKEIIEFKKIYRFSSLYRFVPLFSHSRSPSPSPSPSLLSHRLRGMIAVPMTTWRCVMATRRAALCWVASVATTSQTTSRPAPTSCG